MSFLLTLSTAFFLFNAIIQNGFGIEYARNPRNALIPIMAMILSSIVSWSIHTFLLKPIGFGVFGVFLIFPISVVCSLFVAKISILFKRGSREDLDPTCFSGFNGLAFFSAFQIVIFAQSFLQALIIALGGTLGFLCIIILLNGIQKRSEVEAVPQFFKGQPLLLISTGLVSLVFSELLPIVIRIFTN
ncbi:hypothetical protein Spica_1281 [Gracilinema caldarium DSM 7334]|uniref:Electron transport complex protein RnfA n=1 Tax=Gracilinema caldarium (strain ATCC 51460 / DSM 7334 / H1) TaxID=744872 RepID=F8F2N3_GRAC1|nr:hypothetical protein Spica_1281 [Gracilinema caldarium DSM 7334]